MRCNHSLRDWTFRSETFRFSTQQVPAKAKLRLMRLLICERVVKTRMKLYRGVTSFFHRRSPFSRKYTWPTNVRRNGRHFSADGLHSGTDTSCPAGRTRFASALIMNKLTTIDCRETEICRRYTSPSEIGHTDQVFCASKLVRSSSNEFRNVSHTLQL